MIKKMILKLAEYAQEKNPKGNSLKQIILTLGKDGVYIYSTKDKGTFTHYLARDVDPKDIKSVVGAGDNFLAGFVFGMYNYCSEHTCVNFG
jgi:sugar/nucleoside kinase (ribokinase family)